MQEGIEVVLPTYASAGTWTGHHPGMIALASDGIAVVHERSGVVTGLGDEGCYVSGAGCVGVMGGGVISGMGY